MAFSLILQAPSVWRLTTSTKFNVSYRSPFSGCCFLNSCLSALFPSIKPSSCPGYPTSANPPPLKSGAITPSPASFTAPSYPSMSLALTGDACRALIQGWNRSVIRLRILALHFSIPKLVLSPRTAQNVLRFSFPS